jgi:hypothetical protein
MLLTTAVAEMACTQSTALLAEHLKCFRHGQHTHNLISEVSMNTQSKPAAGYCATMWVTQQLLLVLLHQYCTEWQASLDTAGIELCFKARLAQRSTACAET